MTAGGTSRSADWGWGGNPPFLGGIIISIIQIGIARDIETILGDMRVNPEGIKLNEACKVAEHCFAEFSKPRIAGSHHVYKMPWPDDPRINIQKDGPKAKRYQINQMLEAVDKLKALRTAQAGEASKAVKTRKASGKKGK